MSGADMREVSLRQIAEFERAASHTPARAGGGPNVARAAGG
jgi:hypothetical protein